MIFLNWFYNDNNIIIKIIMHKINVKNNNTKNYYENF